jgi:hypothetical protein
MYYFPAERVAWIVAILSVVISAILLIGAIVALYKIIEMDRQLGIVGMFMFLFATSIGLLTNARRMEVFATIAV